MIAPADLVAAAAVFAAAAVVLVPSRPSRAPCADGATAGVGVGVTAAAAGVAGCKNLVDVDDGHRGLRLLEPGGRRVVPVLDLTADVPEMPAAGRAASGALITRAAPEASGVGPMVRLLGALECDPPFDQLTRRGQELVAYLASHPAGVSDERLRTVLWDRTPTRGSFNNVISTVRTTLGAIDGEPILPRLGDDRRYRLGLMVSDLNRFDTLVGAGDDAAALELVRGGVFDEGHLDWASLEGLTTAWERAIVDVAHRFGRRCLAGGDIDAALWAAAKGLLAAPGDEVLFRDRMLAWDAAGNPAAVESVMTELCAHLSGADPAEVLHPQTLEVYRRCGRGHHLPIST